MPDLYKFIQGYEITAYPLEANMTLLNKYFSKLHIPKQTGKDMTSIADVVVPKKNPFKMDRRSLSVAINYAKILLNT